jgi:hypothetical protein
MIGLVRSIVALAAIFLPTALNAQNQMVEISNLQLANSVSATVQDQTGHPVPGVAIEEYDAGWKQPLRLRHPTARESFHSLPSQVARFIIFSFLLVVLTLYASASGWCTGTDPLSGFR